MPRFLFAFLLISHGLIHLMGFAKAFKLAEMAQLVQPISKNAGLFWLAVTVLFLAAGAFFIFKNENWWMLALPAALISQTLIFMNWGDAKFGTIANLLVLVVGVVAFAGWNFDKMADRELKTMLKNNPISEKKVLTKDMILGLPPVVQKWLEHSKAIGKDIAQAAHLTQTGQMRTAPDGKWLDVTAEQFNTLNEPAFIWKAKVEVFPLIFMHARDKYTGGRGNMLVKIAAIFPVADASGAEINQGSMLRFLSEMCWFPTAILNKNIVWETVDSTSARATMSFGGVTGSGVFYFNSDGDLVRFEAKRFYARKEGATLEDWEIVVKNWRDFHDIRLASDCEVHWKLKTGDYLWLKLEILNLENNDFEAQTRFF